MDAAHLLTNRARLTPERTALSEAWSGKRYTFAELNERANRAVNLLLSLGFQKGDRISILAYNNIAYVDLLYGLAKIGGILAPLNWRLTANELSYIVNDCQPRAILVGPEFAQVFESMRSQIHVEHCISLEGANIFGGLNYEFSLSQSSPEEPPFLEFSGEEPLCILYTSGTTGHPKGAVIPQRMVYWNAVNTVISWGLNEDDVGPILTPMFHAGGLFIFLTPLFYAGGRVVMTRTFDPQDSLNIIEREGCTVVLGVPTLYQMWLEAPDFASTDFSKVRFFISGGAPCPVSLIQTWREATGVAFRQGYGLTEVGTNCFSMTNEEGVRKAGSVGKPIFHSWMRLVDSQGGDVQVGETGELIIAGPHVSLGYWNRPEDTAKALEIQPGFPWPWFHTGDMARQDEEGFFYIAGRYKDMIISGGENVYAAEVEAVFRQHPAVQDAALIGIPDRKWGEVGLMFVLLKPGQSSTETELQEFCRVRLARYKIPKEVLFKDSLPYSPYGKIMKAELKKGYFGE